MSNNTSTIGQSSPPPASPTETAATVPPADPSTAATVVDTSTTAVTSTALPPTTTPESSVVAPTSSSPPPPPPPPTTTPVTTTTTTSTTSASPPPTSAPPTTVNGGTTSTIVTVVTSTKEISQTASSSSTSSATSSTNTPISPGSSANGGLNTSGKIAVGVVVPIAAVALLVLAGIFFWRRHKAQKEADEERRKEVEDYAYNPNADPTIPVVGLVGDGPYEMKEDGSTGYRGWGSTTMAGSTGRKASTTMSGGGMTGPAYSDATSPTRGNISDTRSGEPLVDGSHGSYSPEGEILGAMGPSAAGNRGDVHRGPSNASSSYSAAARSDGSGDGGGIGIALSGSNPYYDQYGSPNPYGDQGAGGNQQRAGELPGQPIIRDNPARRNTRIENPAHYPQQSAGISQNF